MGRKKFILQSNRFLFLPVMMKSVMQSANPQRFLQDNLKFNIYVIMTQCTKSNFTFFGPKSARSYEIGVVGNNWLVG